MAVQFTDPVTGVYEDDKGNWFLKDNTPIIDYDSRTGAYQEVDETWYTFEGIPLLNFDMSIGAYQETDGTWYDTTGKEVLLGTTMLDTIKAYGYNVSQNQTPSGGKTSKNTVTTTPNSSKTATKPVSMLVPILTIVGLSIALLIIYQTMKKK